MKKAMIDYIQKPKFDDIYTPAYAIKPLLKYIPKKITVWECCDFGKSEISRLLKEHGCNVISTDKKGNWFNTSWFCWKVLPKQLIFEELVK